jgi:hypothetical protein
LRFRNHFRWNSPAITPLCPHGNFIRRHKMTWGKGALLWLIGIPLPIIILLALFWR